MTTIRPRIRTRTRTPVTATTGVSPGQFPAGSTVDKCIQGLHQLATPFELRMRPTKSKPPCIANWKLYLRLQSGLTVGQIDAIIIQHQRVDSLRSVLQAWAKAAKKTIEPISVPDDPYHIFVRTKVLKKSGKVKVTLDCPMGDYYDHRIRSVVLNGPPPPTLGEKLIAAKRFGYSNKVLEGIIKADDKWKKNLPKIEEMIVRVFGEGKYKPPTAAAQEKARKAAKSAKMKKIKSKSRHEMMYGED
jgi:hypothetical protein